MSKFIRRGAQSPDHTKQAPPPANMKRRRKLGVSAKPRERTSCARARSARAPALLAVRREGPKPCAAPGSSFRAAQPQSFVSDERATRVRPVPLWPKAITEIYDRVSARSHSHYLFGASLHKAGNRVSPSRSGADPKHDEQDRGGGERDANGACRNAAAAAALTSWRSSCVAVGSATRRGQ